MTEFQPRRILVTGGAGFIGSQLVRHLLARYPDVRVVNLDLLTYAGSRENLDDMPGAARHELIHGDICDRELVDRLLLEREIDAIVHLAADTHVDRSITGPAPFVQTNLVGTFTLLDAAREHWSALGGGDGSFRFVHVSTDEVYGALGPDDPEFAETTPYAPNSPYSASKAGSDHLVRAYHHTYGLPTIITNSSNNYGPRQHREKFIPTVLTRSLGEQPIPVYGDGSNRRDWIHVSDHCDALIRTLERGRPGECYNIGGENEWSNLDLVHRLCDLLDELRPRTGSHRDLVEFVTDRPGHDWRYAVGIGKIRDELGWEPAVSFEEGLRSTIAWYRDRV